MPVAGGKSLQDGTHEGLPIGINLKKLIISVGARVDDGRRGGPLWSPAVARWMGDPCTSPGRGRPQGPTPRPLRHPRPYGSDGFPPGFPASVDAYSGR